MCDSCCLLLWHHCTWPMGTACRGALVFTSFLCPAALRPYLQVNKHANHKLAAQPLQLMHLHTPLLHSPTAPQGAFRRFVACREAGWDRQLTGTSGSISRERHAVGRNITMMLLSTAQRSLLMLPMWLAAAVLPVPACLCYISWFAALPLQCTATARGAVRRHDA